MELVEIRDLDGPNLFALVPTIKLEVVVAPGESIPAAHRAAIARILGGAPVEDPLQCIPALIDALHQMIDLPAPESVIHELDASRHYAVCFPWEWRSTALTIARAAFDLCNGTVLNDLRSGLLQSLHNDQSEDDHPTWVRDSERRIPAIAITGTNGKTTTTRFLAHILQSAGNRVGWSSSSGVYIDGEEVIHGDYTGHGGARRVLTDPDIDYAVLETARGGILLRGLGYESNDVGVFLNVSPDHLHLHGVNRLETLAKVKSSVIRTTRESGVVVLNAMDPLVLAQRADLRAEVILFSTDPALSAIQAHVRAGGRAAVLQAEAIRLMSGDSCEHLIDIDEVPLTHRGAAQHMVENTLAVCAAAIGLGIDIEKIRQGLRTFESDMKHNAGRLNIFDIDDRVVVVDFAHNEIGLTHLISFARARFPGATRLTGIIGTAGDRDDSVFRGLGAVAGRHVDRIVIKENPGYLRGREPGDMTALIRAGIEEADALDHLDSAHPSEFDATVAALDSSIPGESIVVMCVEDYEPIVHELRRRGATEHTDKLATGE